MLRHRALSIAALLLGLSLAVPPTIRADEPAQKPGHHQLLRLRERLGLSDEQVNAIQQIRDRQRESRQRVFQALHQAQQGLRQAAIAGDQAAVQTRMAEVEQLMAESLRLRVQALQEMSPLLTPEQLETLAQLRVGPHRHRDRRS